MRTTSLLLRAAVLAGVFHISSCLHSSLGMTGFALADNNSLKPTAASSVFDLQRMVNEADTEPGVPGQYLIPFEHLRNTELNDLPIGVFDSGIGGLTVLETILGLDAYHNDSARPGSDGIPDFAGEKFIYFGDQANMPYGNYASRGDVNFLRELIVRDAMFLLGTKSWENPSNPVLVHTKPSVKAIVIACNTATAFGLADIREAIAGWRLPIPVIGVVEAGANSLVQELPSDGASETIAVMATVGTCSSNAYPTAIAKAAGLAGKRVPQVIQQGSVGLAGAIEGNPSFIRIAESDSDSSTSYQGPSSVNPVAIIQPDLKAVYAFQESGLIPVEGSNDANYEMQLNSVVNYVRFDVVEMVNRYAQQSQTTPITKVILGCTHFPFESETIAAELTRLRSLKLDDGSQPYQAILAEEIQMIDPADLTARDLFKALFAMRLRSKTTLASTKPVVSGFYFSVANPANAVGLDADGNLTNDYKYGRKPGWPDKEDTLPVPLQIEDMPEALSKLLREKCKLIWSELSKVQLAIP